MEAGFIFYEETLSRFNNIFNALLNPQVPLNSRVDGASSSSNTQEPERLESHSIALESEVLRLFQQQEYYRNAYNSTLNRMETLRRRIPEYALEYLHELELKSGSPNDNSDDSEDIELSPELTEFMLQTLRHREERDRNLKRQHNPMERPPPPKKSAGDCTNSSIISQVETDILHHYLYSSPCRDSPFWPFLPLRRSI